jgi:hypothetical protein
MQLFYSVKYALQDSANELKVIIFYLLRMWDKCCA